MISEKELLGKVRQTLAGALGVDEEEIVPEASLKQDLGAESIDFIDIVFRLEKAFGIKISASDLFPNNLLNDEKFLKDGIVTEAGIAELRSKLKYLDLEEFVQDPQVSKLADSFTVKMLLRYLNDRLSELNPTDSCRG